LLSPRPRLMLMPDTCMADTDILWDMEAMADTA